MYSFISRSFFANIGVVTRQSQCSSNTTHLSHLITNKEGHQDQVGTLVKNLYNHSNKSMDQPIRPACSLPWLPTIASSFSTSSSPWVDPPSSCHTDQSSSWPFPSPALESSYVFAPTWYGSSVSSWRWEQLQIVSWSSPPPTWSAPSLPSCLVWTLPSSLAYPIRSGPSMLSSEPERPLLSSSTHPLLPTADCTTSSNATTDIAHSYAKEAIGVCSFMLRPTVRSSTSPQVQTLLSYSFTHNSKRSHDRNDDVADPAPKRYRSTQAEIKDGHQGGDEEILTSLLGLDNDDHQRDRNHDQRHCQ